MVHLPALPGAPDHASRLQDIVAGAVRDTATLTAAGFDGVMIENFGDAPFFADSVPPITVAALTRVVAEVVAATDLPVGVNVLRNDALAALAIAAATGAAYIRVNVLSGVMYTDQGMITGRAAEVARTRAELCPDTAVLADVHVKHATPPAGQSITPAAVDLWERGGADAVIVSGSGTGTATDRNDVTAVRAAIPEAPLYLGSGATAGTIREYDDVVHGAIVGSAIKSGPITSPVDAELAAEFVAAWRG